MPLEPGDKAPYTTVSALLTTLRWFRDKSGARNKIDADVLARAGVPDSLTSRTLRSLISLDLIDESGIPSGQWLEMASIRGEDEYVARFGEWLKDTYRELLSFADPSTDTYARVLQGFRGYEPSGQRQNMVALFLGLWKYAELPVSDDIVTQQAGRDTATRSTAPKTRTLQKKPRDSTRSSETRKLSTYTPAGIPPSVAGLLQDLPTQGSTWTTKERATWLVTFQVILDYAFPVDDGAENDPETVSDTPEGLEPILK